MPSNVSYKSLLEADVTDCCYRVLLKVVVPISELPSKLNIFVTMLILHRWRPWCYAWKRNPLYPIRVASFVSVVLYLLHNACPMKAISNMLWPSWPWWYGSWICNYLFNQCLSPLMLWVWILIRARCTTLCDKVCQWLAKGRCFSLCAQTLDFCVSLFVRSSFLLKVIVFSTNVNYPIVCPFVLFN